MPRLVKITNCIYVKPLKCNECFHAIVKAQNVSVFPTFPASLLGSVKKKNSLGPALNHVQYVANHKCGVASIPIGEKIVQLYNIQFVLTCVYVCMYVCVWLYTENLN